MKKPATEEARLFELKKKALLLCKHAEELSLQSAVAMRNGSTELMRDLQVGKHTLIAELSAILQTLDVPHYADLVQAVELLRTALHAEMSTLTEAKGQVEEEIQSIQATHRRLNQARQYDASTQTPGSASGGRLSACG